MNVGRAGPPDPPDRAARPEAAPYHAPGTPRPAMPHGASETPDRAARPEAAPYHASDSSSERALPRRRRLPHVAPVCVDTTDAVYFITICAADRANANWVGRGVLDPPDSRSCGASGTPDRAARPEAAPYHASGTPRPAGGAMPPAATIIDAAAHYHAAGKWFVHLMVVMPDHLHSLISFGNGAPGTPRHAMAATVAQWKSYVAKAARIRFQRDFWDTRIRSDANLAEYADYIMMNPVRRALADSPGHWPWTYKGATP